MWTLILVAVGGAVTFAAGWAFARSGAPLVTDSVPRPGSTEDISLDDVLENHPTGVVVGDRQGVVVYRNAAARAMTGTHASALVDEAIERHIELGRRSERVDEALELYGPPKLVIELVTRPLPGGSSVVFVEDVSERRRTDQIRTDFVANISHELKTPIGALSVLAETLVDERDPATVERVVARMMSEAARASRTIDDLMELSRIELGGERHIERVSIANIVNQAVGRVTELATQREISMSLHPVACSGGPPLTVDGDRTQLVSAIGNLVENAVKYSEPGGQVQVRTRVANSWIEIMVADEGVGIPQRDLDRIFERFYRVDRARSRTTGGTGLGLSIVRHVATNHGGEVLVSSSEGEGSTFVFRLPADGETPAALASMLAPEPHEPTEEVE